MSNALSIAEIDELRVEFLPARTVMTTLGNLNLGEFSSGGAGDDGGTGGSGGAGNTGGAGTGGPGGDGHAVVVRPENHSLLGPQINLALAFGGLGGTGFGGDVNAPGGDGGRGGHDFYNFGTQN